MITVCNSARDVAMFVISLEGFREVTNLRLQKLLYFLQGYSFQCFGHAFFPERLEAWTYGPVCPAMYGYFVFLRNLPIPRDMGENSLSTADDSKVCEEDAKRFVQTVMHWADNYTSGQLVEMSHQTGSPWAQVWKGGAGKYSSIPLELIKEYFTKIK